MKPMNGAKPNARELIDRIMADERFQASSHFSERVYGDEPILTTGNRMASYLPDQYRRMRAISRWEPSGTQGRGRWLSEAELFYRQGVFMADYEDDCTYRGNFKSYFPTYNAMSDRQLRGYFTWRAAVRRGDIQETSLSFAYVYLYEIINGIGVTTPADGYRAFESFWSAYRAFAPEIDRFAGVWLQDYVVYHGLSPALLEPYKTMAFDRAIAALRKADGLMCEHASIPQNKRRKKGTSVLPLPPNSAFEDELFHAIDALSTYKLSGSRLYKERPEALRHVACAVYVRTSEYYRKQRKNTLLESWFGEEVALPYTMFGSAVFFAPEPHPDTLYQLNELHRYRCQQGMWTCERIHGSRSRSPKLGACMRATDRQLRAALGYDHPLKEAKPLPKYLSAFVEEEVEAWVRWSAAHAPRVIDIDLSQLAGIRCAAEITRESLLIDEEREGLGMMLDAHDGELGDSGARDEGQARACTPEQPSITGFARTTQPEAALDARPETHEAAPGACSPCPAPSATAAAASVPAVGAERVGTLLSPLQDAYLRDLLANDHAAAQAVLQRLGTSEDLAIDTINEALFDLIGDTAIECGPDGPEVIEDYREDVEGLLNHD